MMDTPNTLNSGMCRCCSSEGTFKDIKTKYHWMGEEEVYADMLTDCFDIKIEIPEGMDNGICEVCITQLRNASNFKKQVLHTEEQFKRRLQNKDIKNPIKLESLDDSVGSDHLSDPDYSGNEYEVPIKEEIEEKPKAKKRSVQATTSRAKKPKTEPESSSQRKPARTRVITIGGKREIKLISRTPPVVRRIHMRAETGQSKKNEYNLGQIMLNSNANPIRWYDARGYMCSFCSDQFHEPRVLKKHFLDEHNDDKLMKRWAARLANQIVKLDITYLNCALCDADFTALDGFTAHLNSVHRKGIYMDIRNQILPFKFDTPELRCAVCSAEFASFKMLLQHMHGHFSNYVCDLCGAGFVSKQAVSNHIKRHGDGHFECAECGKAFVNEQKVREHEKRSHRGIVKPNKCKFCDERFSDYWKKMQHMVQEHEVPMPVLKCHACDRTFNNQRALARHTRKDHLLERKHKCPDCDMKFFTKGSLNKHLPKHTGIRNFKCEVCSKAFGRKKTLTEHMRIHTDDRRFACAQCGQAFIQKCSLKGHMRSKHGESL